MNNYFKIFIKEIVPIILGILIALYINNWNEERKDKKYIRQISTSINKELKETTTDIKRIIPLQKALIDTIAFYLNNDKMSLYSILMKTNGFKTPTIKMNSWKAISNSRIELMEYRKVSTLANIEDKNEELKSKLDKLLNFAYLNLNETDNNKKKIMAIMLSDIIQTETSIQKGIESITSEKNINNAKKQSSKQSEKS